MIQHLLKAAEICRQAYDSPNWKRNNAQGFIEFDDKENVLRVGIAGTNDIKDLIQDASIFGRVKLSGGVGEVHPGFWNYAMDSSLAIFKMISEMCREREKDFYLAPVLVTGHSLGAAAVVCLLRTSGWLAARKTTAILFGCPRVGNAAFARKFGRDILADVHNVQNAGDPIPSMPSCLFGWRHVGKIIEIGRGWDVKPDHPLAEYEKSLKNKSAF